MKYLKRWQLKTKKYTHTFRACIRTIKFHKGKLNLELIISKLFTSLLSSDLPIMNISETYQKVCKECDTQSELTGGEDSAEDVLEKFLTEKLCLYDKNR